MTQNDLTARLAKMTGKRSQNVGYTAMPRRKIVCRFTEVANPEYPVAMIEMECGHKDFDRGQKSHVRCPWCLIAAEAAKASDDDVIDLTD